MKAERRPESRGNGVSHAIVLLAALLMGTTGCKENKESGTADSGKKIVGSKHQLFDAAQFSTALKTALPPATDTGKATGPYNPSRDLYLAYSTAGVAPLRLQEEGVFSFAESFLSDLDSLTLDGLDPAAYGLESLKQQAAALKDGKSASVQTAIAFDTACTRAYLLAARHLLMGSLTAAQADGNWHNANDSLWNAPQVIARQAGDTARYAGLAAWRSQWPAYALLRKEMRRQQELSSNQQHQALEARLAADSSVADSVLLGFAKAELPGFSVNPQDSFNTYQQVMRAYQWRYGLPLTGRLDSATARLLAQPRDTMLRRLSANLERMRWLPRLPNDRYVLANIPQMELFFREQGKIAFHMRTVVGKPARPTPSLSATMQNVVFNPSWGVPPTIMKQDVLPGVVKRGGAYLRRKGLTAYDRRGRPVAASAINAKNVHGLSFRQPPGAHNALGDIKFNLPNRWDIYLHDTPHREDFPKRFRALSSGCVRVARPKDFAEFILSRIEGRNFSRPVIDSLVNTRRTMFEQLKTPIPVHIVYLTAFEDSTGEYVRFLPDVYKKDSKVMALLAR